MQRRLIVLAAIAVGLLGCDAVSTPSALPLLASGAPAAPSGASPTLEELAASYSKALAMADKADEEDSRLWIKSSKDLDAAKARAARRAGATLTFLRTVEELPWPSEVEPTVRRLVKCENTVYDYQENASIGKTRKELTGISAVRKYLALAGRMGAKCTVLANKLRLELGMDPPESVGCGSLVQFHGDLVAENGRVVVKTAGSNWSGTVPIHWLDDWTVRPTDGGQLEVVDVTGTVQARTGTRVILSTPDHLDPFNGDGEFVACPYVTIYNGE